VVAVTAPVRQRPGTGRATAPTLGPAAPTTPGPRPRQRRHHRRHHRRRLAFAAAAAVALALLGGGLWARAALAPDGPRTVEVLVRHSRFEPAVLTARPGETVVFVVHNVDPIDHELIIGDAAVHARHAVGRERHHHGEVPGEVSVPAGSERRTTFRFPTAAGEVLYACHLPGHYAYGMHGRVRVG
jgi:uncharacterized cupredoxin-like copper-binding protein